jgi:DNA-binding NtrC family response regulator
MGKKETALPDTQSEPDASLEELEREHIKRTLARAGNNKSRAARILGIARRTLDRKVIEYGLQAGTGSSESDADAETP